MLNRTEGLHFVTFEEQSNEDRTLIIHDRVQPFGFPSIINCVPSLSSVIFRSPTSLSLNLSTSNSLTNLRNVHAFTFLSLLFSSAHSHKASASKQSIPFAIIISITTTTAIICLIASTLPSTYN